MISGKYDGGEAPEEMIIYEFKDSLWAKFKCIGSMPGSLQTLNNKIWDEWVPSTTKYELSGNTNIEWYSCGYINALDYEAGIWLPVIEKESK